MGKPCLTLGTSENTSRKGVRVCRDESFSHTGKETFPLIPLRASKERKRLGERKNHLMSCLSQSTLRTQRKLSVHEQNSKTAKFCSYFMPLPGRSKINPQGLCGFVGMNLSPIPAKKRLSPCPLWPRTTKGSGREEKNLRPYLSHRIQHLF